MSGAGRHRAEKEAEERRARELADALAQRKAEKRAGLAAEPPAGPGTTQIRLRLPDGTVQQRRFDSSAPLQQVFDFVDSLEQHSALRYVLATSFPKTILGGSALTKSLRDLGLEPHAVLLVQPQDDD
jgi:FAS-associated factor 2